MAAWLVLAMPRLASGQGEFVQEHPLPGEEDIRGFVQITSPDFAYSDGEREFHVVEITTTF